MTEWLWYCPVPRPYYVTQTFDQHPYYGKGTDFGGDNMPIYAMRAGRVAQVVNQYVFPGNPGSGYANWVVIDHGVFPDDGKAVVSYSAHLRANILVAVGDLVKTGQQIAFSDNTGMSTGPHLHSETRKGNVPFDWFKSIRYSVAEVDGTAPPPVIVPTFPSLPQYKILVGSLNIRSRPGLAGSVVGAIYQGQMVGGISAAWLNNDLWIQIGYNQYIAAYYKGQTFAELQQPVKEATWIQRTPSALLNTLSYSIRKKTVG